MATGIRSRLRGLSRRTFRAVILAFTLASAPAAISSQTVAVEVSAGAPAWFWRGLARADLRAARDRIEEHSPILHVARDSAAMRRWLEEGHRRAEALLPQVSDESGYRYLVTFYLAGFRDGHITAAAHDGYRPAAIPTRAWPGIVTAWRGGRYVVSHVAPWVAGGPAVGDVLSGCDGRDAETLARTRIDLFLGNLDQPLERRLTAHLLLWDRAIPFVALPRNCRFRTPGGTEKEVTLTYRPATADDGRSAAVQAATAMATPPALGVMRWEDRGWWIGLPRLDGDADWPAFFAAVEANREAIRAAPFLVIDVRGNGGGNSARADRLAAILWGDPMVTARRPSLGPVSWRATPVVRNQLLNLRDRFVGDPAMRDSLAWVDRVGAGLDRAIADGAPLYVEQTGRPSSPGIAPANPMRARVIMLTDERCFSACLDLMDLFTAMPGVVQAGLPTGADTIFMEVTGMTLPSGKLAMLHGIKAWTERPRGSNVRYTPIGDLTYRGDPADEAAWRAWLAGVLEAR